MHTKGIGRRQGGQDFTNKLERVMNNDEHSEYKTCEPKQSRFKKTNMTLTQFEIFAASCISQNVSGYLNLDCACSIFGKDLESQKMKTRSKNMVERERSASKGPVWHQMWWVLWSDTVFLKSVSKSNKNALGGTTQNNKTYKGGKSKARQYTYTHHPKTFLNLNGLKTGILKTSNTKN